MALWRVGGGRARVNSAVRKREVPVHAPDLSGARAAVTCRGATGLPVGVRRGRAPGAALPIGLADTGAGWRWHRSVLGRGRCRVWRAPRRPRPELTWRQAMLRSASRRSRSAGPSCLQLLQPLLPNVRLPAADGHGPSRGPGHARAALTSGTSPPRVKANSPRWPMTRFCSSCTNDTRDLVRLWPQSAIWSAPRLRPCTAGSRPTASPRLRRRSGSCPSMPRSSSPRVPSSCRSR